MSDFGTYRLTYTPPENGEPEPSVEMAISSEATLTQMVETFQGFLQASGYVLGEKTLTFREPYQEVPVGGSFEITTSGREDNVQTNTFIWS